MEHDPSEKKFKIGFLTFGCRSNYADTVELQIKLREKKNYLQVSIADKPDVIIVNSCTVTNSADIAVIKSIKKIKADNPKIHIVVIGCMAVVQEQELLRTGFIDAVFGSKSPETLFEYLEHLCENEDNSFFLISTNSNESLKLVSIFSPLSTTLTPKPGAYIGTNRARARFHLKIQNGCNESCSYCIVPKARGKVISKNEDWILKDILLLEQLGYGEIVLTGTHIGAYGIDVNSSLAELLKKIGELKLSTRIRLSSLEPADLNSELLEVIGNFPNLCNHIHICIQSLSNDILRKMNRSYSVQFIEEAIANIRRYFDTLCIGVDLIVGFPGESEQSFLESLELLKKLSINYAHVFPFSERAGTLASQFPDQIPNSVRKKRASLLRKIAEEKWSDFLNTLVNKELEVIVEKKIRESDNNIVMFGTTSEFATLKISLFSTAEIGSKIKVVANSLNKTNGYLECLMKKEIL